MKQTLTYTLLRVAFLSLIIAALSPFITRAAPTISQAFSTTEALPLGTIVSLENNAADSVAAATLSTVDNLYGVAVSDAASPVTLYMGKENQVHVATSGTASVLVSDMNGTIKKGDHITISPIKGVGMKATRNAKVIGVAQEDVRLTDDSTREYTDGSGKKHTTKIGQMSALINVGYYYKTPEKTVIPAALQNVANTFAGKTVEPLPLIISGVIFIVMLVVVVSIIYAMIRSSIISVGRNPMSQSAVYRDVIQLSALVLGILAVGIIAIYLILTRF